MSWHAIVEHRKQMRLSGWLMLGAGLLISPFIVWKPEVRLACVVLTLSGIYCHSAALMLGRMADLQAAVDMRKITLSMRPHNEVFVTADDEVVVSDPCTLKIDRVAKITVYK